ncbi:hypothetical protein DF049_16315 [Burkholderia cenocepacia]|nr:hypothetical protein C6P63_19150 [Burkholderia cenocepacia]RQU77690.1 hypothetical protein DF049_16315 [Burkholderia cenocepacia]
MVVLSDAVVGGGPMPCRPRTSEYERGLTFNNSHWTLRRTRAKPLRGRQSSDEGDRGGRRHSHSRQAPSIRNDRSAEGAKRRRPGIRKRTPGHRSTAGAGHDMRCPAPAHRSTLRELHQN